MTEGSRWRSGCPRVAQLYGILVFVTDHAMKYRCLVVNTGAVEESEVESAPGRVEKSQNLALTIDFRIYYLVFR